MPADAAVDLGQPADPAVGRACEQSELTCRRSRPSRPRDPRPLEARIVPVRSVFAVAIALRSPHGPTTAQTCASAIPEPASSTIRPDRSSGPGLAASDAARSGRDECDQAQDDRWCRTGGHHQEIATSDSLVSSMVLSTRSANDGHRRRCRSRLRPLATQNRARPEPWNASAVRGSSPGNRACAGRGRSDGQADAAPEQTLSQHLPPSRQVGRERSLGQPELRGGLAARLALELAGHQGGPEPLRQAIQLFIQEREHIVGFFGRAFVPTFDSSISRLSLVRSRAARRLASLAERTATP